MTWGPFWAQAKQRAGLVLGIMTVLPFSALCPWFRHIPTKLQRKNLLPLQWRAPEVLGCSQIFSAKLTQAKKKNQSANYTGKKKPDLDTPGSESWRRFQLSHSEVLLTPTASAPSLLQAITNWQLSGISDFFFLPPPTVSCVHLFPFCSAFRKENFHLLKSDSPGFSPGCNAE